eukprot:CAMPEP_0176309332 /NCGR_PEP_ID=MMETSP0121_2-20121125/65024_1 /TAXON_ID=160619 /ORGANISM="Kryptoperidinium foliaceum, Strain CCMP 1326" /LENGTH=81 /DNA_ID=CAMNT_0017651231 /DNA_START=48 /DNA_END=291 /DNA_ORIENTATION=-
MSATRARADTGKKTQNTERRNAWDRRRPWAPDAAGCARPLELCPALPIGGRWRGSGAQFPPTLGEARNARQNLSMSWGPTL